MCREHGWLPCQLVKISLSFSLQYVTGCHPRIGSCRAHLRPSHYRAGLINSFSQWSSVAPISCLLFLTVLLPTNENKKESND